MSINWQKLRSWEGSQRIAFEELCCQLASCEGEPLSAHAKFLRKGVPDAGIECYWRYPNNDEWGFQAKFFPRSSDIDWSQLDGSVKTALEKHPALTRYTICLPMDRPDARVSDQESCMQKWDKRVNKWERWAQERSMSVEFDYWGEHEIFTRLSREEHAGRHFFWFNEEQLSQKWFEEHLDEVTANAGPRYSPELNVKLPISQLFHGLGRTQEFFNHIKELHGEIRRAYSKSKPNKAVQVAREEFAHLEENLDLLFSMLMTIDDAGTMQIDFEKTVLLSQCARQDIDNCIRTLEAKEESEKHTVSHSEAQSDGQNTATDRLKDFRYEKQYLHELMRGLYALEDFAQDDLAVLSNRPAFLLVGKAGTGKTHIFCDVAKYRIQKQLPTVLLLGEQFSKEEPWSQLIRQLHLSCQKRDVFLGALDAAAQARNSRTIILIDALNEGEGRALWKNHLAGMLAVLARHPRLGIAISVRTSYEQTVIPEGLVSDKLVREVHYGFATREYEATRKFFDFFNIIPSSVPLLIPEFQNPLFLKIFCQSLKNQGLTRAPSGTQSITAVFRFFIASINKKLAHPQRLDFDEKRELAQKATDKLAELMAEGKRAWLPREDAQEAVDAFLSGRGYETSLFRHLIAEGLLAEDMFPSEQGEGELIEGIRFPYERFADHLIADHLLSQHLDSVDFTESFKDGKPLNALVSGEVEVLRNLGVVEALCVQLPERTGKELAELAPYCAGFRSVKEAFVESLIWRDPKAVTNETLNYINNYILSDSMVHDQLLDALLTVATNPDHPYNADFLHRNLVSLGLAKRDAWWSIFLHYQYSEHGAVDRIIDWAWSTHDRSHIGDESIRLCTTVLTWFLTTSNRFLRDKATKALVSLLTDRIHILRKIMPEFLDVNDPYVLERLFAISYGCAMRSDDNKAVGELAGDVYDWVFRDGSPPPHILLRDYARGVMELALHRGIKLNIEVGKIRPPYNSEWPSSIPTEGELKSKYYPKDLERIKEDRGYIDIWDSVMSFGDFARYVIGTNSGSFQWTSQLLGAPRKKTRKQIYESFVDELSQEQRKKWDELRGTVTLIPKIFKSLIENPDMVAEFKESGEEAQSKENRQNNAEKLEEEFLELLNDEQARLYQEIVVPYLSFPREEEDAFDLSIAQRWIFQRVIELGWTPELFGEFDSRINPRMRDAHKVERIGKKYQWIALHEFLARVSDNFCFRRDSWSDELQTYEGPWQIWRRDIDPSCLISSENHDRDLAQQAWWCPVGHVDWEAETDDVSWLKKDVDLPSVESLIQITDPHNNNRWLTLNGFYEWQEPTPIGEDTYEAPRRQIWYIINSYIVKKSYSEDFFGWLKEQDFMGRWMPEPSDFHHVYIGEYPWASAFGTEYSVGWNKEGRGNEIPYSVVVPCARYMWESGFDCSIDETILMDLPSAWLINELGIGWAREKSKFVSSNGNVVAFDPSVDNAGSSALLISESAFIGFLKENDYEVFWTILGEKGFIGGSFSEAGRKGRLELSGTCRLESGRIKCSITNRFSS